MSNMSSSRCHDQSVRSGRQQRRGRLPRSVTGYPELDAVLRELVAGVREILADNFCGAYLQGSFAVGDADVHSDVDFIVVTHDEVSAPQLEGLQAMHKKLFALEVPWAQ